MKEFLAQGIVEDNRAMSQHLVELNTGVWGVWWGRGWRGRDNQRESCQIHCHPRAIVGTLKAVVLKSDIRDLTLGGRDEWDRLH